MQRDSLHDPTADVDRLSPQSLQHQALTKPAIGQKASLVIIAATIEKIESLFQVLNDLPPNLHSPVIVMLEGLASHFSSSVIERLAEVSSIAVRDLQAGPTLNNCISVAPGEAVAAVQLVGNRPELFLTPMIANNSAPAVLFSSAAITYGKEILVVMLAGTEPYSIAGCNMVRQKGGRIIIESQQDSVRDAALDLNPLLTTRCLPLDAIGAAIADSSILQKI